MCLLSLLFLRCTDIKPVIQTCQPFLQPILFSVSDEISMAFRQYTNLTCKLMKRKRSRNHSGGIFTNKSRNSLISVMSPYKSNPGYILCFIVVVMIRQDSNA